MQARTLQGFMELLPQEQIAFNHIKETIAKTYELFGFAPLDTPILELSEVLLSKSGGETEKQIYEFKKGDTNLAMRFDLTVPLAKYVSLYHNNLTFPFKRYQIGKVYRGERPQKGRFREFYQCDIDIIDRDNLDIVYDAELPAVIYTIFNQLNLPDFKIYINNRKLISGYLQHLQISDYTTEILRIVDKIKKIPEAVFLEELKNLKLSDETNSQLLNFIKIKGSNQEIISQLSQLQINNETFNEGLSELKAVISQAEFLNVPAQNIQIDLSITRGLDYYTGTVYETFFNDYPQFGSVCSGGRYDNLSSVFSNQKLPGVGISIGLTRLFDQLRSNNLLPIKALTPNKALLITQGEEFISNAVKLASDLRKTNIAVDIMYRNCKFKKKMEYANKIGVPYLIIIGEEEVQNNTFTIKNMQTGEQSTLNLAEIINHLKA